ncbi:MAG: ABC transporter ATP-binding protein [Rhodospirillales bacterium]|nr:ABC transporter ATP-binding protein [Rhodospirillales bacterium]
MGSFAAGGARGIDAAIDAITRRRYRKRDLCIDRVEPIFPLTVTTSDSNRALAIRLAGIHLSLESSAGPVNILNGIDLGVAAGETVGIVGPSGSGKTSLLMVIAGLEKPTAGTVAVAGIDTTHLGEDALARVRRDHVGIVFQSFHLIPTMTAIENVAIPLEFADVDNAFDRARAELAAVGLAHRLGHYPGQLSGGEQQRVALARAFVAEPEVLLADEPTGNLDAATGEAVMDVLFEMHRRRRNTLVLVTHAPELTARCTRIVALEDGRVRDQARPAAAAS